jgi:hypothetical protein
MTGGSRTEHKSKLLFGFSDCRAFKHAMTQFLVLCYWGRAGLDGHTSDTPGKLLGLTYVDLC